jgi:hypothetical protein
VAGDGGASRGGLGGGEDGGGERSTTKPIPLPKSVGRHNNDDNNGPP